MSNSSSKSIANNNNNLFTTSNGMSKNGLTASSKEIF